MKLPRDLSGTEVRPAARSSLRLPRDPEPGQPHSAGSSREAVVPRKTSESPVFHACATATFCQRVKPAAGDVLYTKGGTTGISELGA